MNGMLYGAARCAAQTLGRACIAAIFISLVACGGGSSGGGKVPMDPMPEPPMGGPVPPTGDPVPPTPPPPAPPPGSPPKTTLTLNFKAIKTFSFSWLEVDGATEYRLLENPDGLSGSTVIATMPAGVLTHDLEVFLPSRMNARYVLDACNAAGCSRSDDVVVVPQSLTPAIGYVKPSNTVPDASEGLTEQEANTDVLDFSADGKTLAFGVYQEDGSDTDINGQQFVIDGDRDSNSGAVYVLVNNDGLWSQQAYIKASNSMRGLNFGMSLSLSADGNTLAVGATETSIFSDTQTATPNGAVYIFTRSDTTWREQTILRASNPGQLDLFGIAVSLADDGNTLAVGAANEDSNSVNDQANNSLLDSGAAYVFTRSGTVWNPVPVYLKAFSPAPPAQQDLFGISLSLAGDGQTLVVGAPNQGGSGAAYVFARNAAGAWVPQQMIKAVDPLPKAADSFAFSLSLSRDGRTLAAGASQVSLVADPTGPGTVFIFVRDDSNTYVQQASLTSRNAETGDAFSSVSLTDDGNTLAIGAAFEESAETGLGANPANNSASRSGAAYIFTRSGTAWSQQSYIKAPNTDAGDVFGFAVAIAGDGSVLGVMAPGEDSGARGVGVDQNDNSATAGGGAVYLY